MIKIRRPLCFTEIGKKDNQEDYLILQMRITVPVYLSCAMVWEDMTMAK